MEQDGESIEMMWNGARWGIHRDCVEWSKVVNPLRWCGMEQDGESIEMVGNGARWESLPSVLL